MAKVGNFANGTNNNLILIALLMAIDSVKICKE